MLLLSAGLSLNYVKLYSTGIYQPALHCFIQQDKALPDQSGKGKKNSVNQEYPWSGKIFLLEILGTKLTHQVIRLFHLDYRQLYDKFPSSPFFSIMLTKCLKGT